MVAGLEQRTACLSSCQKIFAIGGSLIDKRCFLCYDIVDKTCQDDGKTPYL
ncbi:MAG: hypothetical protein FWD76_02705 [Firmicutes bacterium]|nr:hypothetical protein [Bacillota bacterium]